jgi:hypothetical protein
MDYCGYKVAWCKICNQSWFEIVKEKITKKLFICCSECESEWGSPKDLEITKSTQGKYGIVEIPDYDELVANCWGKYILK